jgi:hypothetical protein
MFILLMAGCGKDSEEMLVGDVMPDNAEFSLFDSNGVDLLNPANENALAEREIKLYYEINGEWVYQFTTFTEGGGLLDYPRHFMILDDCFLRPDLCPESKGNTG